MADPRPCRDEDLAAVVDLLNACDVETLGEPDTTAADIATGWAESSFSVDDDAWVVEDGRGGLCGYAEVYSRRWPGELDCDVCEGPGWHGRGVAEALLDRVIARAGSLAAQEPESEWVLRTWSAPDGPTRPLLEGHGFVARRLFFRMRADLDDPATAGQAVLPDGIDLQPFRPGVDDAAVLDALVECFADHALPIASDLDAFRDRHMAHPDFDPDLWTVARSGPEIAGVVLVADHGDLAFLPNIGVRAPWRHRGLAMALLRHSFELLRSRDQRRLDLGVDAFDPVGATRLYERAGFRVVHRADLLERPIP